MVSKRFIAAVLLTLPTLLGCMAVVNNPPPKTTTQIVRLPAPPVNLVDPRSDDQIAALLPASIFAQAEFPKPYIVTGMMRGCLRDMKANNSIAYQNGKADEMCSCMAEKRVERFKFDEYVAGSHAHWNPQSVPDQSKKHNALVAECYRAVLK